MSTTLLLARIGQAAPKPQDPEKVRSTVTVVNNDEPAAVAPEAPDYNAVFADSDSEGGLTATQLASFVLPSMQYAPVPAANTGDAVQAQVNDGIATKGTAAAREASGAWGHGTMKVVEGIEPTIVDGQQFGGDYFAADRPEAPQGGNYMSATPSPDGRVQTTGENNARDAVQASQGASIYNQMLSGILGPGGTW